MMMDDQVLSRLVIRQAIESDLPAMEWDGEFTHFRNLYADAYRGALRGEIVMWLAELPDQKAVGQAFVSLVSNRPELADGYQRAYVYGFRVRPVYRSLGIGSLIMCVIEADLKQRGYECVTLNVARENIGARRLYERLGYRVTAAEPGNWHYIDENGVRHDVHEPAWRMEKNI
jgi:ribosomal protein S18 acetylase RimI-like enzyme